MEKKAPGTTTTLVTRRKTVEDSPLSLVLHLLEAGSITFISGVRRAIDREMNEAQENFMMNERRAMVANITMNNSLNGRDRAISTIENLKHISANTNLELNKRIDSLQKLIYTALINLIHTDDKKYVETLKTTLMEQYNLSVDSIEKLISITNSEEDEELNSETENLSEIQLYEYDKLTGKRLKLKETIGNVIQLETIANIRNSRKAPSADIQIDEVSDSSDERRLVVNNGNKNNSITPFENPVAFEGYTRPNYNMTLFKTQSDTDKQIAKLIKKTEKLKRQKKELNNSVPANVVQKIIESNIEMSKMIFQASQGGWNMVRQPSFALPPEVQQPSNKTPAPEEHAENDTVKVELQKQQQQQLQRPPLVVPKQVTTIQTAYVKSLKPNVVLVPKKQPPQPLPPVVIKSMSRPQTPQSLPVLSPIVHIAPEVLTNINPHIPSSMDQSPIYNLQPPEPHPLPIFHNDTIIDTTLDNSNPLGDIGNVNVTSIEELFTQNENVESEEPQYEPSQSYGIQQEPQGYAITNQTAVADDLGLNFINSVGDTTTTIHPNSEDHGFFPDSMTNTVLAENSMGVTEMDPYEKERVCFIDIMIFFKILYTLLYEWQKIIDPTVVQRSFEEHMEFTNNHLNVWVVAGKLSIFIDSYAPCINLIFAHPVDKNNGILTFHSTKYQVTISLPLSNALIPELFVGNYQAKEKIRFVLVFSRDEHLLLEQKNIHDEANKYLIQNQQSLMGAFLCSILSDRRDMLCEVLLNKIPEAPRPNRDLITQLGRFATIEKGSKARDIPKDVKPFLDHIIAILEDYKTVDFLTTENRKIEIVSIPPMTMLSHEAIKQILSLPNIGLLCYKKNGDSYGTNANIRQDNNSFTTTMNWSSDYTAGYNNIVGKMALELFQLQTGLIKPTEDNGQVSRPHSFSKCSQCTTISTKQIISVAGCFCGNSSRCCRCNVAKWVHAYGTKNSLELTTREEVYHAITEPIVRCSRCDDLGSLMSIFGIEAGNQKIAAFVATKSLTCEAEAAAMRGDGSGINLLRRKGGSRSGNKTVKTPKTPVKRASTTGKGRRRQAGRNDEEIEEQSNGDSPENSQHNVPKTTTRQTTPRTTGTKRRNSQNGPATKRQRR